MIIATEHKGLYLAPTTSHLANTEVELAQAEGRFVRLRRAIDEIQADYDFIIIDCPSLEDSSDVIPVSHIVDGTILVISLPGTEKKLAKETIERLKRNGAAIVGTVLNKVE